MRVFFALPVDEPTRYQIQHYVQALNWPIQAKPVLPENYHLTLAFLGERQPDEVDLLLTDMDKFLPPVMDSASLSFQSLDFFAHGICYLVAETPPAWLPALSVQLKRQFGVDGTDIFRPHITLARYCPHFLPQQPVPAFQLMCDRFCLYQSEKTAIGVRYAALAEWSLPCVQ